MMDRKSALLIVAAIFVVALAAIFIISEEVKSEKTLKVGTIKWIAYSVGRYSRQDITTLYFDDNTVLVLKYIQDGFEIGETYVIVHQGRNLVFFEIHRGWRAR